MKRRRHVRIVDGAIAHFDAKPSVKLLRATRALVRAVRVKLTETNVKLTGHRR